ncbi:MAG: MBL fold metallo-hydrolase [Rhodothermales bacterium]|nr:MBL fold metallo-hydrolase [Rhodothermales bacterium]
MLSRRSFLLTGSAAMAGAVALPTSVFGGVGHVLNFTPIRKGVGTFTMRGGTIGYLATPDAVVVVDTQYAEPAATVLSGLRERADRSIDVLINTHHHGDHTNGNAVLSPHTGQFIAHVEAARLKKVAVESRGEPEPASYPTTTYSESLQMRAGTELLDLRHHGPAHTGGDTVVHFVEANVVHMGDLVFNRMPPFIDMPGGASIAGWIQTLETVHDRFDQDTVFIHGHAGPNYGVTGTREDLLAFRDFLSGLLEYVQKGLQAGYDVDGLASVDRLPDFPEHYLDSWKDAIPNAIRAAHLELTR